MAQLSQRRVYIETHGCKLNQADTQVLARRFTQAGYQLADRPDGVDVHVVNTCTVTHVADRKARQALHNAGRRNPGALVVATGCYAQRAPNQLAQVEGVDLVLGNVEKDTLVKTVSQSMGMADAPAYTDGTFFEEPATPVKTRAMVKIQEGCDQVCAYCIVPKVRGRERSVPPETLIRLVQELAAGGCQEVVLTGTQLGTYGFDIDGMSLTRLVRGILDETDVSRLRVSSLQPQELTSELLSLWKDSRLCPHFHLALQSGSAAVLKAMRRRYTPDQYVRAVETIREMVPRATITADVIVGFPGESKEQYRETYELCQRIGFAGMHVFPYSIRPGTTAAHMDSQVGEKEKRLRMDSMLSLAKAQATAYRHSQLGTTGWVLWETHRSVTGVQVWTGLTDNYLRVATVSDQELYNHTTLLTLERLEGEVIWGKIPSHT
jgi:threonylcarbamoyladenosine tRNA methylthiotransferase MtaB